MKKEESNKSNGCLVKTLLALLVIFVVACLNVASGGKGGNPVINLMGIGAIVALAAWKPGSSKPEDEAEKSIKPLNKDDGEV